MKKIACSLLVAAGLGFAFSSIAQGDKIIITERPIVIQKQGNVYMTPTDSMGKYYYYTEGTTEYVCTAESVNLAGVNVMSIDLSSGNTVRSVSCYPSTHFSITAP